MFRVFAVLFAMTVAASAAEAQQAQNVERTQHADWTRECGAPAGTNQRLCVLSQVVKDQQGKPIVAAQVVKPPNGQPAILRFLAPLGIWLRPGVEMNIDGGSRTKLEYEICNEQSCMAQMQLSQGLVNAMKRGSAANITLRSIRRQKLDLKVSLRGFTAGYNAL